jgi:methylated-DNA-[protein]-cysteine S-methyltransferase
MTCEPAGHCNTAFRHPQQKHEVKGMKQIKTHPLAFCLRTTPFGPTAILWSPWGGRPKIAQILISHPEIPAGHTLKKRFPDAVASSCGEIDILVDQIEASMNGADIEFSLDALRLDLSPPFYERVLRANYAIPRGSVTTYKLLAEHLENPLGARAVGTAMATNPFPIVIPCHRVIRSDGSLGGYGGGTEMKRALLTREGVAFDASGHVTASCIGRPGPAPWP